MLLDCPHFVNVVLRDEIDADPFAAPSSRSTDTVQVRMHALGNVVVDHHAHLLNVETSRRHVGRYENAVLSDLKFLVRQVARVTVHFAVDAAHGKIFAPHRIVKLNDPLHRVAVNDGLRDGNAFVQIHQRHQLFMVVVERNVKLRNAFQGHEFRLDENLDGVPHDLADNVVQLVGDGGAEHDHLRRIGQKLENVVKLVLEPLRQNFVGFVQHDHFQMFGLDHAAVQKIQNAARASNKHLRVGGANVVDVAVDGGTADQKVRPQFGLRAQRTEHAVDLVGELSRRRQNDGLGCVQIAVAPHHGADAERSRFARAGLRLRQNVMALNDRQDRLFLNGARRFEPHGVYPSEHIPLQPQFFVIPFFKFGHTAKCSYHTEIRLSFVF